MSYKSDFDSPAAVELILPISIIETCYTSSPGVKVEFITTNVHGNYVNHVSVLKLPDLSVRLTVAVLPIRDGDQNRPEFLMIQGTSSVPEDANPVPSVNTTAFADTLIEIESSAPKTVTMEAEEDFYGPLETESILPPSCPAKPMQRYNCDVCASSFDKKKLLSEHVSTVHSSSSKDAFKCSVCKKGFSNPRYLNSHIASCHTDPSHICSICRKAFRVPCNLRRHMKLVHQKDRVEKVECKECGKLFTQRSNLQQHVNEVHLMTYPSNCAICKAGFHTKRALHKHMQRLHANVSVKKVTSKPQGNLITLLVKNPN